MKAKQYINMMGMAAAVLLSSCVKDTLYDTPHPDYGKIAVTADWSARGEGIDIPATWTVTMGDYTGTETSATHAPDHLFAIHLHAPECRPLCRGEHPEIRHDVPRQADDNRSVSPSFISSNPPSDTPVTLSP